MKLSIITVNLNNREGLQRTIDSVVCQTFRDFEWIVIDGGSTDGSRELIEQYADHFAYWVSEPDKGIYNAMNKGIKVAKGEYLQFLNSGDWLNDERVLSDFIHSNFTSDIIDGDIHLFFENDEGIFQAPEHVDFEFFIHNTLWHPTAFIKRHLFEKYGCYNEEFRIISDRDFFLRALVVNHASYNHFKRLVSCFTANGLSSNPEFYEETLSDIRKSFVRIMPEFAYDAYMKLNQEASVLRAVNMEYENLKKGKFGFIIRLLLLIKKIIRHHKERV